MAEVIIQINDRDYPVACEDGQEEHVSRLGSYVDMRVKELIENVGQIGDARLLLMAGLTIADELSVVYEKLAAAKGETDVSAPGMASSGQARPGLDAAAEALNAVADRVEHIAARLESA